jgi:hypothetical protein
MLDMNQLQADEDGDYNVKFGDGSQRNDQDDGEGDYSKLIDDGEGDDLFDDTNSPEQRSNNERTSLRLIDKVNSEQTSSK